MRYLISILLLTFLFGCNTPSEKEEIKKLFYELTDLELPNDFEVTYFESKNDYQSNDSDFTGTIIIKFDKIVFEKFIEKIKNSEDYLCDEEGKTIDDLIKKDLDNGKGYWMCFFNSIDFMSYENANLIYIEIYIYTQEIKIELKA